MVCSSCNDWLDIKPDRSLVIPETIDDYYSLLNNGAKLNSSYPCLGLFATTSFYVTEQVFGNGFIDWQKNAYSWTESTPYNNLPDWNTAYSRILLCNLVIEGMNAINPPISNTEYERFRSVIGQAHFFRAINYFALAQIFSNPYNPSSDNQELTIPIKISTNINEVLKNSRVVDLYNFIINDLRIAVDYLPMGSEYFTRPNKLAVWALFSRIYLSMSNYESSKKYSDSLLSNYSHLMNYNNIDNVGTYPFSRIEENSEIIFYNTLYPFSSSRLIIDSNLIKKFDDNDLRKELFFKYNASGQASYIGSYAGSGLQFGGLAVDEIYLNRAESNARIGNLKESIEDINTLLIQRFKTGTYIPVSHSIGKDSIIKLVIEERRKELIFRGVRWYDVRRLTTVGEYNNTEKRVINGEEYLLEPRSFKYTFPIPHSVIEGTKLAQNEGWDK